MASPSKRRRSSIITYGRQSRRRVAIDLTIDDDVIDNMSWVPSNHQPEKLVSKQQPASQKAATMATEPSEANIESLRAMMDMSYSEASRWLRVKQNDPNAALNAIFDNEDLNKLEEGTTWDDSLFSADREGNQSLHPLGTSAAPTRGPSPAPSLGLQNPKTKDDEDKELERAMALSRGEVFTQETGVVSQDGTESKYFGPANRDHYETGQWAMVHASAAQEIVPDLPPKDRLQDKDHDIPRLLKHLPDGDYTPNFLTIIHSIPKAREALLMRQYEQQDYGNNPEWWKGQPISLPRIVNTADGTPAQPEHEFVELIMECQRLMAFLDSSKRTYATIEGITKADIIRNDNMRSTRSGSLLELFLTSWVHAALKVVTGPGVGHEEDSVKSQIDDLFVTTVNTTAEEGMAHTDLTMMDLSINTSDEEKKDLFELIDDLIWDTDPDAVNTRDNYVERPAEILVMKLSNKKTGAEQLGVKPPDKLNIDKYLKENVAVTKSIRQRMALQKQRFRKIEKIEKKLKIWKHPTKSTDIDAHNLLSHTLGHFSGQNRKNADKPSKKETEKDAKSGDEAGDNMAMSNHVSPPADDLPEHYPPIATQLEQIIANIDKKLEVLAEEKKKTRAAIAELSKSPPPELEAAGTQHWYTLAGVATKPNVTYVLHRETQESDTDLLSSDPDEVKTTATYEWWRLAYEVTGSSATINRNKMDHEDVLRAVELEHHSALLVYANDTACDSDYFQPGLPRALERFIERDNNHFANELAEDQPPAYEAANTTTERRGSDDSMRPELGTPSRSPLTEFVDGDPPVAEIYLDDDPIPNLEYNLMDGSVEMKERVHEPLIPRPAAQTVSMNDDTDMTGAESQDAGVGGAMHVEDTEMK